MDTQDQDWAHILGFDRLPYHTVDKRVSELLDLRGKKAIVTGAGGDGLGQAIANRLGGCGADIALVGRTFEKVERRAKEVEQRWGVRAVPIKADMSDWEQVHRAVAESRDALGGLDIITQRVQLGRAALPEQVANVVAFLASPAADYMCGQTIDVAGGQWMG